jgi:cysteine desulfurase family protein (TIGR01976 family)
MARMLDVPEIRRRFPALVADPHTVHADAPGGTQILGDAVTAMVRYLAQDNANLDGAFPASRATGALVDHARQRVATFLGGEPEGIVFGPNMTTLTYRFAQSLEAVVGASDEIVCTQLDHDANVHPWLHLAARTGAAVRWVPLRPDGTLDVAVLDEVSTRTRVIAFPAAANSLGTVVDPAPFVAAARRVGAITFMDAVHAAPHVAVDQRGAGVDVVACSPYKFFGPHAGVLSARPELLAELVPLNVRPASGHPPRSWEVGTKAFEALAGTVAAVDYLLELGHAEIRAHEQALSRAFLDGLADLDRVRLHGPAGPEDRTPTFAITVADRTPEAVAAVLGRAGINAWSGHYYAVEPMSALDLFDRGGAVRIGFVHYHGSSDIERTLDALHGL